MYFTISGHSPIFALLSTTIEGLPVIRAYKMENNFFKQFQLLLDDQTTASFLFVSGNRWLSVNLDAVVILLLIGTILTSLLLPAGGKDLL